ELARGDHRRNRESVRSSPFEVTALDERGRAATARPQRRQQPLPPRQPIVPLEIDRERFAVLLQQQATGRAPLLDVEIVGHGDVHDALAPGAAREAPPARPLARAADAAQQPPPDGVAPASAGFYGRHEATCLSPSRLSLREGTPRRPSRR